MDEGQTAEPGEFRGSPDSSKQGAEQVPEAALPPVPDLVVAKLTDIGRARPRNEDYVDYYVPTDPQQLATKGSIYLVADGMGGHQAGDVASQGAVELVMANYYGDATQNVGTSLVQAFHAANQEIYAQSQADPTKDGMGTTLVVAVLLGYRVYVANVGDSRAYLINAGGITQITEDHSWVEEQVRTGLLTAEQARRHPQRNLVTRALGSKPSMEVDLFEGEIRTGDVLLLCSDGLTNRVEDEEVANIVHEHTPQKAAELLVELANDRGGNDNITVLIVSAQEEGSTITAQPIPPAKRKSTAGSRMIPILVSITAILALALVGLATVRFLGAMESTATPTTASIVPTAAATQEVIVTPTKTQTSLPTDTPEATATLKPTSTNTPSPEPTNTASPTATTEPPTDTPPPTAAPKTPTSTPRALYSAPNPLEPPNGTELTGKVLFSWDWAEERLQENEAYDLYIWWPEEEAASAQDSDEGEPQNLPTTGTEIEIGLQSVPTIADHGPGVYYWTVVVIWAPCYPISEPGCQAEIVSELGESRTFTYTGDSGR